MRKSLIKNAGLFDGLNYQGNKDILLDGPRIEDIFESNTQIFDEKNLEVIDATGKTLMPGLIDSHTHVDTEKHLADALKFGITTMAEMANHNIDTLFSLKKITGLPELWVSCYPATAEQKMSFTKESIIENAPDARRYVDHVISMGADFIKIIIEDSKPHPLTGLVPKVFTLEELKALTDTAHAHGKKTVAHVTTTASYALGVEAGIDILTHVPLVEPLGKDTLDEMKKKGTVDIPTLIMMEGVAEKIKKQAPQAPVQFEHAHNSVKAMHLAGIPILAGTDANDQPASPFQLQHGSSLLRELHWLKEAGMSHEEVLSSATAAPAKYFGIPDKGFIRAGNIADLLLLNGNPLINLNALTQIDAIWVRGIHINK